MKQGFDTLNKIAQFVASVTSEQEAHNWLQRNETHSLLEVKAGQTSAAIEELRQVAVDVGTALATMQTDVIAKIGGPDGAGTIQSSVSTNATAIATVNGKLAASWSVTLNANGYVSGIRSYNDSSMPAPSSSETSSKLRSPGRTAARRLLYSASAASTVQPRSCCAAICLWMEASPAR